MRYFKFITETMFYLLDFILAVILVKILRLFKIEWKSNIWVIGGNGGHYYSDNSAEMHNYILNNYPTIEIYWIIEKDSPDVSKAKRKGPVLYKHSLKGNIYSLLANVLICNHSIRGDIMRGDMKRFKHSFTVNLGHGITAFKEKKSFPNFDMVIATSDFEKKIKENWMNNTEEKIIVSGFPRYDTLYKRKKELTEPKYIFYMPTWRDWLKKNWISPSENDYNQFRNSSFFNEISNLLNDNELNNFLWENSYILKVFIHKNLHPFLNEFFSNQTNIEILSKNTNVQEQLLQSSLLITDYSSIAWDFLYLDRPVIFYQFDHEVYKKNNNSYISLPKDLFGPVTYNYQDTIKVIKDIMNEDLYQNQTKRENMKNKFIKYDDDKNCERVMECILDRKP